MHRHIFRMLGAAALLVFTAAAADSPATGIRWGQFWGTWVWQTQVVPGVAFPTLITFNIDGTITGADSGGMTEGALHGVWERTGFQSLGGTTLYFMFDAQSGVVMAFARTRSSLNFSKDFNQFQGTMFLETLACPAGPPSCPDPLDPTAQWVAWPGMPADGFPVSGARLQRVPAGPLVR